MELRGVVLFLRQKIDMFKDIVLCPAFIGDYGNLPLSIKKRVDRRIMDWSITGALPPSAQAHRAHRYDNKVWIIYVSGGQGAYRMLGEVKEQALYLYRVGDHEHIQKELMAGK